MIQLTHQELRFALTGKQQNFVVCYFNTKGNGPESAMMAYNCSTRASARVMAHRALHNPKVRAYIESLIREYNLDERFAQGSAGRAKCREPPSCADCLRPSGGRREYSTSRRSCP